MRPLSFLLFASSCVLVSLALVAEEVRASSFGWDAADATAALQAAIDSGAARVVVDRQAGDWFVRPVVLRRSNQEIVIEDGVALRAKKGEFKGIGDRLVTIPAGVSNVVLRGEGKATLAMEKRDYQSAGYAHSQWRHAVSIIGARNVAVSNLTILASGGDGVYVAGNAANVRLDDLDCRDHHRQGISVISAVGLRVSRCQFSETRGTPPQCGLDIEPNGSRDRLEDILFEDCDFSGNALSGVQLWLTQLSDASSPVSIAFRRCRSTGNGNCGFSIFAGAARGMVSFNSCEASANRSSAFAVLGQRTGGLEVAARDSTFDAGGSVDEAVAFGIGAQIADFGGVLFDGVRVIPGSGGAFRYSGPLGTGLDTSTLSGGFLERGPDGEWRNIVFADLAKAYPTNAAALRALRDFAVDTPDFRRIRPLSGAKPLAKPAATGWFRGKFTFVQHVPSAGEWPVVFHASSILGRNFCARVKVLDAAGTETGSFRIEGPSSVTNVIHATEAGVARYEIDCGGGLVSVESRWPGQGILADVYAHPFCGRNRRFYFAVPSGDAPVRVMIRPQEPCSARLLAPDGSIAAEKRFGGDLTLIEGKRERTEKMEVWTLEFPAIEEDVEFRIGAPGLPIVATAPEATMIFVDGNR